MSEADSLRVWMEDRVVGTLWRDTAGAMGFRYDPEWRETGFAISRSLPPASGEFPPEALVAHRFFANLLPEGDARAQIVRELRLPDTDFELLRAIGGECAGALSILPPDRKPSREYHYRKLDDEELARLAARRGRIYTAGSLEERPRLSLAGAQNKCPVLRRDGCYWLPQGEAPSSHILKFELADYRHVPAYETFTARLAAAVGLPVAEIRLRSIEGHRFAEIDRYDRIQDEHGEVRRLHQEDFCQALGYGHEHKYQEHGGPSFADCYRLVQAISSEPALDVQHLLRWQVFNVLAGNSDGHAKNLALLYSPEGGIRLAPFYDMVCTRAIEGVDEHLALDVGGERNPSLVTRAHWEALARACDVRPRFLLGLVNEMVGLLQERLAPVRQAFEEEVGEYPALQRIEQVISMQIRRAARALPAPR